MGVDSGLSVWYDIHIREATSLKQQKGSGFMGVKDTETANYVRRNDVFADAFNFYIYGGEQVIDPDSLVELDAREISVPYGGAEGAKLPVQRTRDVIKAVTAKTDRKTAYLILGVENQSNVHYAMPVKNLMYDALRYSKQVDESIASHKISGDYHGIGQDEYLSGFLKRDHLIPVITLVLYFGPGKWDGPMSIHEMFQDNVDSKVLALVPDYRISLIAPANIPDGDFDKFSSSLKEVLSFVKYSKDKSGLDDLVHRDEKFQHLGRTEVGVLNACTGAKLPIKENEEEINVCKAMEDLKRDSWTEGVQKGAFETTLQFVKNLMANMGVSADKAMETLNVPLADREKISAALRE